MYFAWSPKHSSFVCRLNEYRGQHSHHFRRPPTARPPRPLCPRTAGSPQRPDGFWGKTAWGRTLLHYAALGGFVANAELLLSKGAAVDAKDKDGPGLKSGKQAPDTESRRLGHLRRLFRDWNLCIFRKCLAKLWVFHSKNMRNMSGTMITM